MDNRQQFRYEFEGYVFDEIRQSFFYQEVEIRLPKRNFDVLSLLIKKAGYVIDKQEFYETVWAETSVEDGSLAVSINSLRKVFETHSGASFIETYPRRGYKFTAAVKKIHQDESENIVNPALSEKTQPIETGDINKLPQSVVNLPENETAPENNLPKAELKQKTNLLKKLFKSKLFLVLGILLIGLLGTLVFFFYQKNQVTKEELVEKNKFVMFPLTNLKPDAETDYLGPALAERISNILKVSANYNLAQVTKTENSQERMRLFNEYTAKYKVNLAVVGTYLIGEKQMEVSVRLINTINNEIVLDKSFKIENKNISTVPHLISDEIISKLGTSTNEQIGLDPEHINEEAYRNYLKARLSFANDQGAKVIQFAKKTVEIEPDFYNGWFLLGKGYVIAGEQSTAVNDYYEKGIEIARKIKELDPGNPSGGILLTQIYTDIGRLEDALREHKSLPQGRNNFELSEIFFWGAYICRYGGLLDESYNLLQKSNELTMKPRAFQPPLYYRGDYEGFKKLLTTSNEPSFYSFHLGLMGIYQNDPAAIKNYFQFSISFNSDNFDGKISEAVVLHIEGKTGEGFQVLQQLEKDNAGLKHFDSESLYILVIIYAYLGDNEGAIRVFKRVVDHGFFCYPYFLNDPLLNKLRGDDRFQQILELARQKHLRFKEIYYSEPIKQQL